MAGGVSIVRQGDVFVMTLDAGQNRFNPGFVQQINDALDEVEASKGAAALVTTGKGKFFSNGLDLQWLQANLDKKDLFFSAFQNLLARVLSFPVPTVAAINGHAAAGGCMLSLAHDYRIMRAEKGYIFLNEIDIGLPFTPGMNALNQLKLPARAFRDAILTGKKFTGEMAAKEGIVDRAMGSAEAGADGAGLVAEACKLAGSLAPKGKDRAVMGAIKREAYKRTIGELVNGGLGYGATVGGLASQQRSKL